MPRPFSGRATPGGRHFDSLGMALRAFELVRVWRNGACMTRDRIERTERAALYLHRRVLRYAPPTFEQPYRFTGHWN